MTQDEIIEMTRKAGWSGIYIVWAEPTGEVDWSPYKVSLTVPVTMEQIEAFAKLVAAKEREAIYQLVMEALFKEFDRQEEDFDGEAANAMKAMAFSLTSAIRARGEA